MRATLTVEEISTLRDAYMVNPSSVISFGIPSLRVPAHHRGTVARSFRRLLAHHTEISVRETITRAAYTLHTDIQLTGEARYLWRFLRNTQLI